MKKYFFLDILEKILDVTKKLITPKFLQSSIILINFKIGIVRSRRKSNLQIQIFYQIS
jgi:hypothetical protein